MTLTAKIFNHVTLPDTTPVEHARYEIRLIGSNLHGSVGYISPDRTVQRVASGYTDADGKWLEELPLNTEIDPDGTVYEIREYPVRGEEAVPYYILVSDAPADPDDETWVGTILTTRPDLLPDDDAIGAINQHLGDLDGAVQQLTNESAEQSDLIAALTVAQSSTAHRFHVTPIKTALYVAAMWEFVRGDVTAGAFNVRVPGAALDGDTIVVKKVDASTNVLTVIRTGSDVFDLGGASIPLSAQGQTVTLVSNGQGTWTVLAASGSGGGGSVDLPTLDARYAQLANNLSDLASAPAARTNLGLGTAAVQPATAFDPAGSSAAVLAAALQRTNNLSDLANPSTARANLGLGSAATQPSTAFDPAGAAAAVAAAALLASANLSDLTNPTTARANLGLGSAATHNHGDYDAAGAAASAQAAAVAAATATALQRASNLSDIGSAPTARTNLGLGSAATQASSAFEPAGAAAAAQSAAIAAAAAAALAKANNLSDLPNAATARTNLGLGSSATQPSTAFEPSGSVAAASAFAVQKASNLSDLANAATARGNLGLGTSATHPTGDFEAAGAVAAGLATALLKASNLGDLPTPATARTNLGLGTAATHAHGDYDLAGAAATAQAAAITAAAASAAQRASNLSDLSDANAARTNLGLHAAATLDVGTTAGTVAAGNDARFVGNARLLALTVRTGAYTAQPWDAVRADATSGSFTVTLPLAATAGDMVIVKKSDATVNTVTVQRQGADTINFGGLTSQALTYQDQTHIYVSDGAGKWITVDTPLNLTAEPITRQDIRANRPAANAGVGFFFATDENGGTLYHSDGTAWSQVGVGVTAASGLITAGPSQLTTIFDVKAVGTTITDIGQSIAVPLYSRPQIMRARYETVVATGTALVGTLVSIQVFIRRSDNVVMAADYYTVVSTGSSTSQPGRIILECYLDAGVAAATYKISTRTVSAIPTGWTSASLFPGYGVVGSPTDNFYAEAK